MSSGKYQTVVSKRYYEANPVRTAEALYTALGVMDDPNKAKLTISPEASDDGVEMVRIVAELRTEPLS